MKTVRETIGNTSILIQTMDDEHLEIIEEEGPNLIETGIPETLKDVYKKAKATIRSIAEDIGNEFESIQACKLPKQVEMEFNMGFSAQAGIWVLGGKNDYSLKVKLIWEIGKEH